ncbi:hypothetical protein PWT90_10663 [Aphanocladium album]|nr:hypothetical protein PWT90_10663 [Aphanocladium album]
MNPATLSQRLAPVTNLLILINHVRRVKCDEATPVCRRCFIGYFDCRYGALIPLGDATRQVGGATDGRGMDHPDVRLQQTRERRIFMEVEPFNWDYQQAIRYYFSIVSPFRCVEGGKVDHPHFNLVDAERYTMRIICDQLSAISKSNDRKLAYGDSAATSTLWASYARYQRRILDLVNQNIRDDTPRGKYLVIQFIDILIYSDYAVEWKMWRTHIEGGFAYLESIGGIQAAIALSSGPLHPFALFLRHNLDHDLTTPALQHILEYQDYTEDQLTSILYEDYFSAEQPYPLALRIIKINITRLRHHVATATITSEAVIRTVSDLFGRLVDVDIESWDQNILGFDITTSQPVAELYRDAIWLYALLTLPRAAMRQWASGQPQPQSVTPEVDSYDYFRSLYTSRLLAALRMIYPSLQYPHAVSEALVIVGVALATTGRKEDREFVDRCLHANWRRPVGGGGVIFRLLKLREFWASGKTEWEECFYEPTP